MAQNPYLPCLNVFIDSPLSITARGSVGLLERQIRNPSPVIGSRSESRGPLSRSQSPIISTWRQRQSSPHFTKTPDSRVSNSQKHIKSSDSKVRPLMSPDQFGGGRQATPIYQ
ncbi:hypothetical protein ACTXT7_006038 [Hymenolepis weldensis]